MCGPVVQETFKTGWNASTSQPQPVVVPAPDQDQRVSSGDTTAPGRTDLAALAQRVIAGAVPAGSDATFVDVLAAGVDRVAGVDDALRVVLARNQRDNVLAARIRALLAE